MEFKFHNSSSSFALGSLYLVNGKVSVSCLCPTLSTGTSSVIFKEIQIKNNDYIVVYFSFLNGTFTVGYNVKCHYFSDYERKFWQKLQLSVSSGEHHTNSFKHHK